MARFAVEPVDIEALWSEWQRAAANAAAVISSYEIVNSDSGQRGIRCLVCGRTSWNINDVNHRYCGNCHKFHHEMLPGQGETL